MRDIEYTLPSYNAGRHWLVGAKTYLTDRMIPSCEEMFLPPAETIPGMLRISLSKTSILSSSQSLGSTAHLKRKLSGLFSKNQVIQIRDKPVFDLRFASPSNWAHAFTVHLPLVFLVRRLLREQDIEELLIILPKSISKKIVDLFYHSGFSVLSCDKDILANQIIIDLDPLISMRGCWHKIIQQDFITTPLFEQISKATLSEKKKIFVSRKTTRRLKNEDEIADYLQSEGYDLLYPEDYSLIEQIVLLSRAENIVAIHGAGLGPLLLRKAINDNPFTLIELFNPAHLTNVFRVITHQLGGEWIGVRGKIWPGLARHAYKKSIVKYSLNDFSIDKESLECAFNILENN